MTTETTTDVDEALREFYARQDAYFALRRGTDAKATESAKKAMIRAKSALNRERDKAHDARRGV